MSTSVADIEEINHRRLSLNLRLRTFFVLAFFVFIGLFFIEAGVDTENYTQFFDQIRTYDLSGVLSDRVEPLFGIVSFLLVRWFSSNVAVYAGILILSVSLKAYILSSLRQTGVLFALFVAFYLFRFFPLLELTQIRVSLALGLVLCAFQLHGTRFKWMIFLSACLTHYSVIVLLPFLFLVNAAQTHSKSYVTHERLLWLSLFVGVTVLGLNLKAILQYITPVFAVLQAYDVQGFGEVSVSPFNATILLDIGGILTALALQRHLSVSTRFWIYMQVLGVLSFYWLIEFPILAFRIKDLFCIFWLFYVRDALESHQGAVRLHAVLFVISCMIAYFYFYFLGKSAIFPIVL